MAAESVTTNSLHLQQSWIKKYYSSFNGIRGLAVLMVFIHHYADFWHNFTIIGLTWTGVDLFFVLSGFLITGILYDSLHQPHFFRDFYIRRALRIFPIFYGFFLLLFLLTPILHLIYERWLISYFFYVGNLIFPFFDPLQNNPTAINIAYHGGMRKISTISHLWSLCVEEQFYLVWPAAVWFVRRRRRLMHICVVLSVLTLALRITMQAYAPPVYIGRWILYWSTYTRCDTLLIGSWFALWLRGRTLSRAQLHKTSYLLFWMPLITIAVGVFLQPPMHSMAEVFTNPFIATFGFSLIALSSAGLILFSLDERTRLSRLLQNPAISGLGVISYGFYFVHLLPNTILVWVGGAHPKINPFMPLVAFVFSVAVATFSFHFFEAPFLKLKNKLAPGHKSVPSGNEEIELTAHTR